MSNHPEPLISPEQLHALLHSEDTVVVDCRFTLGDPGAGRHAYLAEHLPGARYADLGRDLSGPLVPRRTGRHPLPSKTEAQERMRRLGIDDPSFVVAYDAGPGHMAAARLWWILQWMGHDSVAVLDGGFDRWRRLGLPLEKSLPDVPPGDIQARFRDDLVASMRDVERAVQDGGLILVDSRAASRFRGENETIDPVAGHIPGAYSVPFAGNTDASGAFRSPEELRARFRQALPDRPPSDVAFYCGSGVTAAHNVLAFAHAGLGMPRLYPGSWSEWITDPSHPVETGPARTA